MTDWVRGLQKETPTYRKREELIKEFAAIINKHSLENDANIPDFIIGEYLFEALINLQITVCQRSVWFNPKGFTNPMTFDEVKQERDK